MASGSNRPLLSTLESRQMWKLLFLKCQRRMSPQCLSGRQDPANLAVSSDGQPVGIRRG